MSLAIAEKRPQQRPGGCVGIFFQLFDWNRRLAKKKLFSKKLLPPVRAVKRASKKFGSDDKMPKAKLLLIASENRGGFPKPEADAEADAFSSPLDNGMRAPGLVARLMGLESMPAVQEEKPRKALDSKFCYDGDRSCEYSRLDQSLCPEPSGHGKLQPRPQKLQKTAAGFLERRPVSTAATRFSSDAFHKAVLSRSRKHHHKLASPVKSPRLLSRSNTARLVQAATKILEPGLQSRNRAKCAITYMGPLEGDGKRLEEPGSDSLVGSCRSCGTFVEVSELRVAAEEALVADYGFSVSDFSNGTSSYSGSEENRGKSSAVPSAQIRPASLAVQAKINVQSRGHDLVERKHQIASDRNQYKPRKEVTLKPALKRNKLRQNQLPMVRDEEVPVTKVCSRKQSRRDTNEVNGAKDFVSLNKNLNNCARIRSPNKITNIHRVDVERNGWEKDMGRKRRPISGPHVGNMGAVNSTFAKERSAGSDCTDSKGTGFITYRSINQSCNKTDLQKKLDDDSVNGSKDNGIVSFTFNSPMRHDSRSFSRDKLVEKRRGQAELDGNTCQPKKLVSGSKVGNLCSQRGMSLRGDKLSSLLEEKIRELSSLDQDELATRDALPGRSTASILEELISALTMETPESKQNDDSCSDESIPIDTTISCNQMTNISKKYQEERVRFFPANLASDGNQPSPISILEASFSNDSCSFGSSGGKLQFGLADICTKRESLDQDTDLLDSATSVNITNYDAEKIPHSIDKGSNMHDHSHGAGLSGIKPTDVTEAFSGAELLFENIPLYWSVGRLESSFDSFLLDTLETIVDAFCASPKCNLSSKEAEDRSTLRELLFDCMMECLNSNYSHFCRSGFRTWLKLPLAMNGDRLRKEVFEEIRGWRELAGKILDDLVDKEMSRSSRKWTWCETEAFETGTEIESDVLEALLDDLLLDLC